MATKTARQIVIDKNTGLSRYVQRKAPAVARRGSGDLRVGLGDGEREHPEAANGISIYHQLRGA